MNQTANKAVAEIVKDALEEAEALRQEKRYDDARNVLIEALSHNQNSSQVYYRLGNIFFDQKNYDKAEYSFRRAIDFDANHINAHHNLSVVFRRQGRVTAAVQQRKKANKIARQNPEKINFNEDQKKVLRKFASQVLLFGFGFIALIGIIIFAVIAFST
jgi:tetratricopeptide (TPR) repeat protein